MQFIKRIVYIYKSVIKFYVSKYHGETNFMILKSININVSFFEQFYIYSFVLLNLLFRNTYFLIYVNMKKEICR